MNFIKQLNTNKIIDNNSILENRLKQSKIEYNFLKDKLLENNYILKNYKYLLNDITIDINLIKNPLYNLWISTIKDIIKQGALKEDNDYAWNSILYTLDSNKYERILDKIILELLSIRLFCDIVYLNDKLYDLKVIIHNDFHIPLYYKANKKIKISKIVIENGKLYINNFLITKGTGCKNDLRQQLYFFNDSNLKFRCNNVPSIIIDKKNIIKQEEIKDSFKLLNKLFKNDIKELLNYSECAYMIHSNDNNFFSGNDEINLGLIYLPNIKNKYYLAECILHEFMHQRLCVIENIAKIFVSDNHLNEKFYSPWRNDARPLRMVIHGLYVFTAIIEYWSCFLNDNKMNQHAIENCYLRILQNKNAIKIINKYSKLTILGQYIITKLIDINTEIEEKIKDKIENDIKLKIKNQVLEHKKKYKSYVS